MSSAISTAGTGSTSSTGSTGVADSTRGAGARPRRAAASDPRAIPRPVPQRVRVMPQPVLKLPRMMPQPVSRPVRVLPQPTTRPLRLMSRAVAKPVRPAPTPLPPRVTYSGALHLADNPVSREELRGRGTTVVADQVFEKIAAQAASEVATSRGRTGGVLGIGSDADPNARPKVDVELSPGSVDIDIAAGIAYPGSIRTAAQQIRDHVSSTVRDLTGVPVHRVDIDVTFLSTPSNHVNGLGGGAGSRRSQHRKQALR